MIKNKNSAIARNGPSSEGTKKNLHSSTTLVEGYVLVGLAEPVEDITVMTSIVQLQTAGIVVPSAVTDA